MKIIFFFMVFMRIVRCILTEENHPMASIVDYMKENLSTYQVTVMAKSINALGSFSSSIVKIMIDEFSSVVVDSSAMDTIPANRSYGNLWDRTSDQSKLKIGIVELRQNSDTNEELSGMLDFFIKYSEFVRGKCMIFLINGQGLDLEPFLKFAWTKDFLDLTVIEWIDETSKKSLTPSKSTSYGIFIHVFNPFEGKYIKETFRKDSDVLPDKLKNLHGHSLETRIMENGWFNRVNKDYNGPNTIDRFGGTDVHRVKLLAEELKFTANPKFIKYEEWMSCEQSNNNSCYPPTDITSTIFSSQPMTKGRDPKEYMIWIKNDSLTNIYMPMFGKTRLFLIQKRVTESYNSHKFLISCGAMVTALLTILLFSRILGLDKKIWTAVKVAQMLLGGSMANQKGMTMREKIFLITVYFTSIIIMTITSDELLKMNLDKREILRFKTLQELADSGVSIRITNDTKNKLLIFGQYSPVLQKIADQSIASEVDEPTLENMPLDQSDSSIYGGLIDEFLAEFISVGSINQIWFASEIEEDILSMDMMPVRKNFPYKDRFDKAIPRLRETGLMIAYARNETDHIKRIPWREQSASGVFHPHHSSENDIDIEMPLKEKLILVIFMGYCIACVRLTYEIMRSKLRIGCVPDKTVRVKHRKNIQKRITNLMKSKLVSKANRIFVKNLPSRMLKVTDNLNLSFHNTKVKRKNGTLTTNFFKKCEKLDFDGKTSQIIANSFALRKVDGPMAYSKSKIVNSDIRYVCRAQSA
ncbi:hypothetical protein QAD02_010909 [Eretmocerus hayati]|uniref:Uncharacterized protein n=1 Tax=Eretmocerus hayati TaxID=131215 RepID=A0ACC2NW94_9HYME|nr:hypothetical protein QAD02_010909 [Eretmocerus hayati]